jgi:hypothetical protein
MDLAPSRRDVLASAVGASAALARTAFAEPPALQLTAFTADVTPPRGHPCMAGGIAPAARVDDPLFAHGIVLLGCGKPDVERGGRNICLLNIERLAAALAMPLSALFQRVEKPWRRLFGSAGGRRDGRDAASSERSESDAGPVPVYPVHDLAASRSRGRLVGAGAGAGTDLQACLERLTGARLESGATARRAPAPSRDRGPGPPDAVPS